MDSNIKTIIFFLTILLTPLCALANEDSLTSTDLIIAQTWLAEHPSSKRNLLYNEVNGKKYQWIITKKIFDDEIQIHFESGKEIDNSGTVIGIEAMVSDQFFTLLIDKKSYILKGVYQGG